MFPSKNKQINYALKITELMLLYCYKKNKTKNFAKLINDECDIYRKTDLYNLRKKVFYKDSKKKWIKITKKIEELAKLNRNDFLKKSLRLLNPYLINRIKKNKTLVEYNTSAKFGCFDFSIVNKKVDLHMPVFRFIDPQYSGKKFFTSYQKFILRSEDLLNLISFVRKKYPSLSYVQMGSWMNQYEQFRVLFPKSWLPNGKIKKKNSIAWWGQFLKSDGDINMKLYRKFKKNLRFEYSGIFYQCKIRELYKHLKKIKND